MLGVLDGKLTNLKRSVTENGLRLEYLEANRIEQNKFFQNALQKRIPLTTNRQPRTGRMIKRKAAEIEDDSKETPIPPVKKKKGRKLITEDEVKRVPPTPDFENSDSEDSDDSNTIKQVECFICGEPFSCRKVLKIHWDYSNCEDQLPAANMTKKNVIVRNNEGDEKVHPRK